MSRDCSCFETYNDFFLFLWVVAHRDEIEKKRQKRLKVGNDWNVFKINALVPSFCCLKRWHKGFKLEHLEKSSGFAKPPLYGYISQHGHVYCFGQGTLELYPVARFYTSHILNPGVGSLVAPHYMDKFPSIGMCNVWDKGPWHFIQSHSSTHSSISLTLWHSGPMCRCIWWIGQIHQP